MKIVFVDTNIWIYAHTESPDNQKHEKILSFFQNEIQDTRIISSVQVINEFHWILLKKFRIKIDVIEKKVKSIIKIAGIVPVTLRTYKSAGDLYKKYKLSFWDSLIVASALENNAGILYSEDMQKGLVIKKKLKIINPVE